MSLANSQKWDLLFEKKSWANSYRSIFCRILSTQDKRVYQDFAAKNIANPDKINTGVSLTPLQLFNVLVYYIQKVIPDLKELLHHPEFAENAIRMF
jgi:hypothetical protein